MNKLLIIFFSLSLAFYSFDFLRIEENFDVNDVENKACKDDCEAENVREWTEKGTSYVLMEQTANKECFQLFQLCIKYRTCQENCVPEMPVLPYKQAKEIAERVRPPLNPCLDLVTVCNFESMDSYETLRTENPFLYI
ncbi:hypothetical protein L3Y34_003757 [Caenorhabditis briggsae]|uniref:Uncharacterized protein n=1 Tax=Caenorhabditis briggsae TaxID=6238 RepID=A0AAE9AGL1_CAEBR|nr:hypothetical protein L3Y34_003757 [Caenorhabditis briggsae]